MGAGVENVSDHGTIGPRKFLGLPENILCFRSKKEVLTRHKDKFLIGRLLNLKMTRTDALMNRPPPPRTLEKCGGYIENDSGLSDETSPLWGNYHS